MTRERPILFSAPMVRAILAGAKTQTRRVVSPRHLEFFATPASEQFANWDRRPLPYGGIGDRLWVRETFKAIASGEIKNGYGEVRYGHAYQADGATIWAKHPTIIHDLTGKPPTGPMHFQPRPWKPSIHMPKRASRIKLEITDVRVQRLQEISKDDARAEGVESWQDDCPSRVGAPPRLAFRALWESINGAGSWDANPWVWALTFRRTT